MAVPMIVAVTMIGAVIMTVSMARIAVIRMRMRRIKHMPATRLGDGLLGLGLAPARALELEIRRGKQFVQRRLATGGQSFSGASASFCRASN